MKWKGGSKSEYCLAHCEKYGALSAKERGDMVLKGKNCLICLHHDDAAAVMRLAKEGIRYGATQEDVWTAMDKKYLDP